MHVYAYIVWSTWTTVFDMTPAQREVFLIIDEWWKRFGYGPSLKDIQGQVDKPQSIQAIQKKVKALVKAGICKGQHHRARSVRPSGMRVSQII
jgi:SOS-response transcriptional repressor LexA